MAQRPRGADAGDVGLAAIREARVRHQGRRRPLRENDVPTELDRALPALSRQRTVSPIRQARSESPERIPDPLRYFPPLPELLQRDADVEKRNVRRTRPETKINELSRNTHDSQHQSPFSKGSGITSRLSPGTPNFYSDFTQLYGPNANDDLGCCLEMDSHVFRRFLDDELDAGDSFWDLIVLTKHSPHPAAAELPQYPSGASYKHRQPEFWATTCGHYVAIRWPSYIDHVRNLFQLLESAESDSVLTCVKNNERTESISIIEKSPQQVMVKSSANILATLIEAIGWLFAVVQYRYRGVPEEAEIVLERVDSEGRSNLETLLKTGLPIPKKPTIVCARLQSLISQ